MHCHGQAAARGRLLSRQQTQQTQEQQQQQQQQKQQKQRQQQARQKDRLRQRSGSSSHPAPRAAARLKRRSGRMQQQAQQCSCPRCKPEGSQPVPAAPAANYACMSIHGLMSIHGMRQRASLPVFFMFFAPPVVRLGGAVPIPFPSSCFWTARALSVECVLTPTLTSVGVQGSQPARAGLPLTRAPLQLAALCSHRRQLCLTLPSVPLLRRGGNVKRAPRARWRSAPPAPRWPRGCQHFSS